MFYFIKKQSSKIKKVVVDAVYYDWMHFNIN